MVMESITHVINYIVIYDYINDIMFTKLMGLSDLLMLTFQLVGYKVK